MASRRDYRHRGHAADRAETKYLLPPVFDKQISCVQTCKIYIIRFPVCRIGGVTAREYPPVVQVCYDENNKPQFTVLNPSHLPVLLFGMNGKATPTAARLDKFFADRCFPSTRQNAKELLAIAGLTLYQPKLICRKTHGIVAHDHYWIRYADDPSDLSYASLMQEMSKAVKAVPSATPSQRHIG